MKTNHSPSVAERACDDAAAAWLCERAEGFSPERARAFAAWCEADPRHAAAVARVERALALLDEMPAVRVPLEARVGRVEPAAAPQPAATVARFPRAAWLAGLAAALAIGGLAAWLNFTRAPAGERYATTAAAPRRVALDDGSVVDLNAGSDVRIQLSARERRVTLGAGEAHFEVAHDATRPFVVAAGGVSVRAVGTAFTVRLARDAVDVLVVDGRVEVLPEAAGSTRAAAATAPSLGAGERARVWREAPAAVPAIEKASAETIRAALAWQDPIMSFTDVPLREVVARFNRRNATQLVVGDAALGERKIGGMIALDQIEGFVRLLEQDGDIVAERPEAGRIVLRRAR